MTITDFKKRLAAEPESIAFKGTMNTIEANYDYSPTAFTNGETENSAGSNEGSCKLFAFAKLQGFDEASTLACFGDYYRKDVLENPGGTDHGNIRNFMKFGWRGINFQNEALTAK